jgi:hypothetical protein
MNVKVCGHREFQPNFTYYPGILLSGIEENHEQPKESQYAWQDLNPRLDTKQECEC